MPRTPYGSMFTHLAAEAPDRIAVVCGDESITRHQLERRANRMARAYLALGVVPSRLVSIGLPNGIEFIIACVAAWKCGAVPNPLSPRLPPRERQSILALADPALIVGFEGDAHRCPSIPPGFEPDPSLSDEPLPEVTAPHERALASGGSTGVPKLIVISSAADHDPEAPATVLAPKGCVLVPGPLYHAAPFGSLTQSLLAGEETVVMPRFDASECLRLIERHRVDQVLFVPTMMLRIWRLPEEERLARDVSSLRIVFTGSAPCPAWLMRAWIDWVGPDVMREVFGGSERIGGTMITGREWLEHPGSVGKPMGGVQVCILDPETREPVAAGEVGEIYMIPPSGPGSTYQYIGGGESRATGDGWESIGDLGYLDEDGYLYLADRRTDMILSGGRNIYPAQVEAAIEQYPAVVSSAVIGLPDEDMGERVHAIVYATAEVDEAALRAHLAEEIISYAIPRSFEFVDEPLRDEAGKLRRWELREARRAGASPKSPPRAAD